MLDDLTDKKTFHLQALPIYFQSIFSFLQPTYKVCQLVLNRSSSYKLWIYLRELGDAYIYLLNHIFPSTLKSLNLSSVILHSLFSRLTCALLFLSLSVHLSAEVHGNPQHSTAPPDITKLPLFFISLSDVCLSECEIERGQPLHPRLLFCFYCLFLANHKCKQRKRKICKAPSTLALTRWILSKP